MKARQNNLAKLLRKGIICDRAMNDLHNETDAEAIQAYKEAIAEGLEKAIKTFENSANDFIFEKEYYNFIQTFGTEEDKAKAEMIKEEGHFKPKTNTIWVID